MKGEFLLGEKGSFSAHPLIFDIYCVTILTIRKGKMRRAYVLKLV